MKEFLDSCVELVTKSKELNEIGLIAIDCQSGSGVHLSQSKHSDIFDAIPGEVTEEYIGDNHRFWQYTKVYKDVPFFYISIRRV